MSSLYRSRPTWHSRTVVGNGMINTARPTLADRRPGVLLYLRLIGLPGRQTSGRPLGRQGVLTGETIQPAQTGMVLTAPRGPPRSARAANGWRLADSGLFVVRKTGTRTQPCIDQCRVVAWLSSRHRAFPTRANNDLHPHMDGPMLQDSNMYLYYFMAWHRIR